MLYYILFCGITNYPCVFESASVFSLSAFDRFLFPILQFFIVAPKAHCNSTCRFVKYISIAIPFHPEPLIHV